MQKNDFLTQNHSFFDFFSLKIRKSLSKKTIDFDTL